MQITYLATQIVKLNAALGYWYTILCNEKIFMRNITQQPPTHKQDVLDWRHIDKADERGGVAQNQV